MNITFKPQAHRKKFTDAIMRDILNRIDAGEKLADLERATGIAAHTIKRKLILLGHKTRGLSK